MARPGHEIEDDAIFEGAILRRVTPFGDGVVVLGNQGHKLVGWYSPDGATWQKTTVDKVGKNLELFPEALTDGPAGLIAVASVVGQDLVEQRFYGSPDGQAWEEIEPPSPTAPGIFVSLESTDDEYFAVARPMFTPDTDLYWRSADGVSWETFEGPADGTLHDLAIGDDGSFVAVGQQADTFTAAIWRADELGSWELVYNAPSARRPRSGSMWSRSEALASSPVAAPAAVPIEPDRYCPTASILASDDGREWRAPRRRGWCAGSLARDVAERDRCQWRHHGHGRLARRPPRGGLDGGSGAIGRPARGVSVALRRSLAASPAAMPAAAIPRGDPRDAFDDRRRGRARFELQEHRSAAATALTGERGRCLRRSWIRARRRDISGREEASCPMTARCRHVPRSSHRLRLPPRCAIERQWRSGPLSGTSAGGGAGR